MGQARDQIANREQLLQDCENDGWDIEDDHGGDEVGVSSTYPSYACCSCHQSARIFGVYKLMTGVAEIEGTSCCGAGFEEL